MDKQKLGVYGALEVTLAKSFAPDGSEVLVEAKIKRDLVEGEDTKNIFLDS